MTFTHASLANALAMLYTWSHIEFTISYLKIHIMFAVLYLATHIIPVTSHQNLYNSSDINII